MLDVVALRSGASFLETGMFLDDGLVAGSWEMFMRIWITKRVESSVLPSMKLWSTKMVAISGWPVNDVNYDR